jgi:hypothetical protein
VHLASLFDSVNHAFRVQTQTILQRLTLGTKQMALALPISVTT